LTDVAWPIIQNSLIIVRPMIHIAIDLVPGPAFIERSDLNGLRSSAIASPVYLSFEDVNLWS